MCLRKGSSNFMDSKCLLSTLCNSVHLIYFILIIPSPYNMGKVSLRQDMRTRRTGFYYQLK